MGLHRAHRDWRSLVVRSRSPALTARILAVLGLPCHARYFIDGVPDACSHTYKDCMSNLLEELGSRNVQLVDTSSSATYTHPGVNNVDTASEHSEDSPEDSDDNDGQDHASDTEVVNWDGIISQAMPREEDSAGSGNAELHGC